ncbi:hypothetical protein [Sinorhizobium alkalisoli]|uniref:Uncharacterized protein n=1 Tax=Sinorhizobium alkalisoli TaxID=1752398 RepID=A0A1E3VH31_9HYPH|nr:hypothetical protein [Sinorhizobium alkalisoli]MCA1491827.1 hypothetical protein [Ensifer sp. NBAIM29]MCG5480303.1 hypothetical protein [Sinorhizobium alkalisoli]ODR92431.1 hypothetical protein A8M32_05200 [Sinorhizobium alkalisoli]QFI66872.1 hypothetical protein EKH55_1998 [Sinorhizobium alkalisoli]
MNAETYAIANLAALNLIEAVSAAYYVTDAETAARHEGRAREMLKKIAAAMGYDIAVVDRAPQQYPSPSPVAGARIRLVSERAAE